MLKVLWKRYQMYKCMFVFMLYVFRALYMYLLYISPTY